MENIHKQTWFNEQFGLASHLLFKYGEPSFIILKVSRIAAELLTYSALTASVFAKPYKFLKKTEDFAGIFKGISSLRDLFKPKLSVPFVIKNLAGLVLLGLNVFIFLEKSNIISLSASSDYKKILSMSLFSLSTSAILLSNKKRKDINSEQDKLQNRLLFWKKMNSLSEWQQYTRNQIFKCQQKMNGFLVNSTDYNAWENKSKQWRNFCNQLSVLNQTDFKDKIVSISNLKIEKLNLKLEKIVHERKINYCSILRNFINITSLFLNAISTATFFKIMLNSIDISLTIYSYSYKLPTLEVQQHITNTSLKIKNLISF